ncbi:MAG TPA: methionyl-tRNA formyltransferase, partial [Saprospiraceae bacterium]|nr:methionyl-tRNA formyltransferase [Saprospiraceae bacterium]
MGTPEFAVPSLDILLKNGYEVVGVITSTDKYGGRGNKKLIESAIKKYAVKKGLKVLQPKNLKAPEFVAELRSLNADLQVVVAFRMLPVIVWDMPTIGTINLHGSLLPKYRGAAPINWAVINGEKETGVTTFFIRHEIDTGDLLFQEKMPIGADETVGEVHDRMMYLGADLVLKTVKAIESNNYQLRKQDESLVSKAPKIYTADCEINFNQPTQKVHDFIRGLSPYPTAWTTLNELKLKIFKASREISKHTYAAGQFFTDNKNYLKISTADGFIQIHNLQLQGRKRLGVKDFLNGYKIVLDMNEKKRYNIFVSTKMNTFNILDIDESELEKIIALYKYGKDNIFLKGKKYWFSDLSEIQIYTFENEKIKTEQELISLCKSKKLFKSGMFG